MQSGTIHIRTGATLASSSHQDVMVLGAALVTKRLALEDLRYRKSSMDRLSSNETTIYEPELNKLRHKKLRRTSKHHLMNEKAIAGLRHKIFQTTTVYFLRNRKAVIEFRHKNIQTTRIFRRKNEKAMA